MLSPVAAPSLTAMTKGGLVVAWWKHWDWELLQVVESGEVEDFECGHSRFAKFQSLVSPFFGFSFLREL